MRKVSNKSLKGAIMLLTPVSTFSVSWHMWEEYPGASGRASALTFAVIWLVLPYAAALLGLLAVKPVKLWTSVGLSAAYCSIFMFYALRAPSVEHGEGAGHMHLVLVPFLLLILGFVGLIATRANSVTGND